MTGVFLLGDSHVVALGRALQADPDVLGDIFPGSDIRVGKLFSFPSILQTFYQRESDRIIFTDDKMQQCFRQATGMDSIRHGDDRILAFSSVFTTTILLRSQDWQQFSPWRVCDGRLQPLSDKVMRDIVIWHFRFGLEFFRDVSSLGISIMALESPPTRRDDPRIGVSVSPEVWLEVDAVARNVIKQELAAIGVRVIPAPDEAFEGGRRYGFLRECFHEFGKRDYHHANIAYGSLALKILASSIAEHKVSPASILTT